MVGGVHQLKAMFEKTSDSISPDRGRLGAITVGTTERSPTPLSKVRISFIAVQGNGQRSNSVESTKLQKNTLTPEIEKTDESSTVKSKSKMTEEAESTKNTKLTKVVDKSKQVEEDRNVEKTSEKEPEISINVVSKNRVKKTRPSSDRKIPETVSLASTQNRIISSASTARNSPKTAINPSTKRSERKENVSNATRAFKSSRINGDSKSRPSMSNNPITKKTESQASTRQAFLQRLPTRSPISQVHLSTSPKTNAASSSFKTSKLTPSGTSQQTLKQTSGKIQPPNRSQSRISIVSNFSSVSKSQISKRRSVGPSLAEETSKKPLKESITSRPATPEPGFLARMMRPTTSSASKAAEKSVPTTRTIKSTPRQAVRNTANDGLSKLEQGKKISTMSRGKKRDTSCTKSTTSASKNPIKKPSSESTPKPKKSKESDVNLPTAASKLLLNQNTSELLEHGISVNSKEDHPHLDNVTTQPANSYNVSLPKQEVKVLPSADLEHCENSSDPIFSKLVTTTNIDQTPNSDMTAQSPLKLKEKIDLDESQEKKSIDLNTDSSRNGEVGATSSLAVQNIIETVNTEKAFSDKIEAKSQITMNFTESKKKVEDKNMNEFKEHENSALYIEQDNFVEDELSTLGTTSELPSYEISNYVVKPKQLKSPISSPLIKMEESTVDPDISLSLEIPKEIVHDFNTEDADTISTSSNIVHQSFEDTSLVSSTISMPLPSPSHFDNLESDVLPSPSSIESHPVEALNDLKNLKVD